MGFWISRSRDIFGLEEFVRCGRGSLHPGWLLFRSRQNATVRDANIDDSVHLPRRRSSDQLTIRDGSPHCRSRALVLGRNVFAC